MNGVWFSYDKPFIAFHWNNTNEVLGFQSKVEAQERLRREGLHNPYVALAELYVFESDKWNRIPLNDQMSS